MRNINNHSGESPSFIAKCLAIAVAVVYWLVVVVLVRVLGAGGKTKCG